MKKFLLFSALLFSAYYVCGQTITFHDFTVKDIDGNDFSLSCLKGKKVMVVNVASKCGLTGQYEELQELYEKYGNANFTIIGFPANNFMGQEPGSEEEIKNFCTLNYGVTFPMMSKISVQGADIAPVYGWLTLSFENGVEDAPVTWNFQKFLIGPDGSWQGVVEPRTSPLDESIINWINKQ